MKKLIVLRSVSGTARAYADREYMYFDFFENVKKAIDALKSCADRPWFVIVDASGDTDMSIGAIAASWGYLVETKSVP